MYELKKIGKVFTSKFVGTGPSSYKKRIYRAAVSQTLRNIGLDEASFPLSSGSSSVSIIADLLTLKIQTVYVSKTSVNIIRLVLTSQKNRKFKCDTQ